MGKFSRFRFEILDFSLSKSVLTCKFGSFLNSLTLNFNLVPELQTYALKFCYIVDHSIERGRGRGRERQRQRETERDRERDRERQRQRETDRERQRETETERDRQRERQRQRERRRQRERT